MKHNNDRKSDLKADTELISMLEKEPDRGMEALLEKYTGLVWHVASKYLPDPEDRKDCVNETFSEVYIHRKEYDPDKGSLALWIGTIAKYHAFAIYRKTRKHEILSDTIEKSSDKADQIADMEQSLDLQEAIASLSDLNQQIIRMKYYDGMSISQIAESLDIPYETAKKRHTRSVKSLRKMLLLILVLAALLLVSCGIIKILQHFQVFPGFGVTTREEPVFYVLEEPVTVENDPFTVEITQAALFDNTLTVRYRLSATMESAPIQYSDQGAPYRSFGCQGQLSLPDGTYLDRTSRFGSFVGEDDDPNNLFMLTYILSAKGQKSLGGEEQIELMLSVVNLYTGDNGNQQEYEPFDLYFSLTKAAADTIENYPYIYEEEIGGVLLQNTLSGDQLSLEVYPLSTGTTSYYEGLNYYLYHNWGEIGQSVPPVTILDEEGNSYVGEPPLFLGNFLQHRTEFTFTGIEPGTYTLSLPYIHLTMQPDMFIRRASVNLEDCTYDDKIISFSEGTVRITGIRRDDAYAEDPDLPDKFCWEIRVRCELKNPDMTVVEMNSDCFHVPISLKALLQNAAHGCSVGPGLLDEETGELVFHITLEKDKQEEWSLSHVSFLFPADFDNTLLIRYDHPLELEFEVE